MHCLHEQHQQQHKRKHYRDTWHTFPNAGEGEGGEGEEDLSSERGVEAADKVVAGGCKVREQLSP
eukprot:1494715-Rhodomonas_salina.3